MMSLRWRRKKTNLINPEENADAGFVRLVKEEEPVNNPETLKIMALNVVIKTFGVKGLFDARLGFLLFL